MIRKPHIPIILLAIAGFLPSLSFQYFLSIPYESYVFKALGMVCLVISIIMLSANNFKIRRETVPLIFGFCAVHFFALISEIINSIDYALLVIFRLISIILFSVTLLNLDRKSLLYLFKISQRIVISLILISFVLFISGGQYGEKFPILGIYANQSLIFEVNMYGILCYTLFFSTIILSDFITVRKRIWLFCISIFGVFISFYRTVWITFLLAFFVRSKVLASLLLGGISLIFLSDLEKFSTAFKFEQLSTLTGRDVAWSAALSTFKNNPFWGGGEQGISEYIHEYQQLPWDLHSYHSVLFDIIGISGAFGIIGMLLYFVAIVTMMRSLRNLGLFTILYMPAFLNTYYLFAPNAVGFFCTITFLVLSQRSKINREHVDNE